MEHSILARSIVASTRDAKRTLISESETSSRSRAWVVGGTILWQHQSVLKDNDEALTKSDAMRKVRSFIQNIHHFRDDNLRTDKAPIEKVAVFDEAQRTWDKDRAANFMKQNKGVPDFAMSEPEFLISVMDRHLDWCTIICLIGGGQEINSGEAGLTEWFSALRARFHDWRIYTSPALSHRDYHWGHDFKDTLKHLTVETLPELHLAVSVRSFRAEQLAEFVSSVIAAEADAAFQTYQRIKDRYPIFLTRDLAKAERWLRSQGRAGPGSS